MAIYLVTNSKEMRLLSNGLSAFATESGTNGSITEWLHQQ